MASCVVPSYRGAEYRLEIDRAFAARVTQPFIYGLPHKGKKLINGVAVGESPAVVYPASEVDSVVVRASMESAGASRQIIQAAGKLPEELSASDALGCARLAMWVNQSRRKRRGWNKTLF